MQPLLSVKIPNYIRKVQLSKAQRVKPYKWNGFELKAGSKTVPRKYLKKGLITFTRIADLRKGYFICMFKGAKFVKCLTDDVADASVIFGTNIDNPKVKFLLTDAQGNIIPSNPKVAGTPRFTIINFQQLYSGNMHEHVRWKIMKEIKKSFLEALKGKSPIEGSKFPIAVELVAYDTVKNIFDNAKTGHGQRWDVGNRYYLYMKAFLDLISNGHIEKDKQLFPPIIPDDDRLHITSEKVRFIPIAEDSDQEPCMWFLIYPDESIESKQLIKPIIKKLYNG